MGLTDYCGATRGLNDHCGTTRGLTDIREALTHFMNYYQDL